MKSRIRLPLSNLIIKIPNWINHHRYPMVKGRFPDGTLNRQWTLNFFPEPSMAATCHILESVVDKPKLRPKTITEESIKDRSVFHEALEATTEAYLKHYEQQLDEVEIIGVHLIFLMSLSHYGVTGIITNSKSSAKKHFRKYVLTFSSRKGDAVEIVITCGVSNSASANRELEKIHFYALLPLFDQLVYSIISDERPWWKKMLGIWPG